MITLLDAALAFADAGCSVVPARPDGSKAPAGAWKRYIETAPDRDVVARWLTSGHPDGFADYDGFGVVCGAVSGGLEMVEVEGRAVGAMAEVKALADASGLGELWARVTSGYLELTPAGGFHILYRLLDAAVPGNLKLARDADGLVLAETRGEGGYVIVAPSAGRTHPTGAAWTLLQGGPGSIAGITADEREALHALFRALDRTPAPLLTAQNVETIEQRAKSMQRGEALTPGDDYNDRATWAEILEPRGWRRVYSQGGTTYWRRPGKDTGVSATTGRNDGDNLYVFSSSTDFEQEKPYSKFAAFALLDCAGDYSNAARRLRAAGYGGERPTAEHLDVRDLIAAQPAVAAGIVSGDALLAEMQSSGDGETLAQTWRPVDLTPYLDGSYVPEEPTGLVRADGMHLLYAGRVHSFHGESESGKSMLAQAEAARALHAGDDVLYVDFESDAGAVTARLRDLGADAATQLRHLCYVRPEGSPYALAEIDAWRELLGRRYRLAVLDGVTDALATFGTKSSSDNDEITTWMRAVPRAVARLTGAAVVLVDHVTKDAETRGRFAVGGQAKMNGLDGAAYVVEVVEPLGRGLRGVLTMRVAKDRPGSVRPVCGPFRKSDRTQEASRVVIDSTGEQGIEVTFGEPLSHVGDTGAGASGDDFRPTGLMERISRVLEDAPEPMGLREVVDRIKSSGTKARDATLRDALKRLADEGFVARSKLGQKHLHTSRQPYRQTADPTSDAYIEPVENLIEEATVSRVPTVSDRVPDTCPETVSGPSLPYGDGTQSVEPSAAPTVSQDQELISCGQCFRPVERGLATDDGLCPFCRYGGER